MDDAELMSYYQGKSVQMLHTKTFVDYEDIESPVKSILMGTLE